MYDNLNLRVYRRTRDHIALLWSLKQLTREQIASAKISLKEPYKELTFAIESNLDKVDGRGRTPDNTAIAIIPHEANKLDPTVFYELKVSLGVKKDTIEQSLQIYPCGVLPQSERDKKDSNVHMMGWSEEEKRWIKVPLVKTKKGLYAIPTILIEE